MGIADRDYYRAQQSGQRQFGAGRRIAAVRYWSVTNWLIAICVAVFVLDRTVLPIKLAPTGEITVINQDLWAKFQQIPRSDLGEAFADPGPNSGFVRHFVYYVGGGRQDLIASTDMRKVPFLQKYLQFTTAQALMYPSKFRGLDGFEFWRFLGYQFLHANITHLLFNMLGLWMFGRAVEEFLGRKRFLAFYLLCGLFGAVLYMLLNAGGIALTVSGASGAGPFLPNSPYLPLIGASASVYGVIMAGAYLSPNDVVYLLGIIPMRLKTLAIFLIVIAVATLVMQGSNAGGEAAHLGGALAGFWFIRKPHQLHGFFDFLGRADPTSRSGKLRRSQGRGADSHRAIERIELDRVLDKIREHGMHSLSEHEKKLLRDASRSP
ncbi:MAG: rhomboid family intramembrane serine protease [Phycisphaerae bacterium]|nr:rhomboid family intramembrane serine protease [Phycisphaerae bacterium]